MDKVTHQVPDGALADDWMVTSDSSLFLTASFMPV